MATEPQRPASPTTRDRALYLISRMMDIKTVQLTFTDPNEFIELMCLHYQMIPIRHNEMQDITPSPGTPAQQQQNFDEKLLRVEAYKGRCSRYDVDIHIRLKTWNTFVSLEYLCYTRDGVLGHPTAGAVCFASWESGLFCPRFDLCQAFSARDGEFEKGLIYPTLATLIPRGFENLRALRHDFGYHEEIKRGHTLEIRGSESTYWSRRRCRMQGSRIIVEQDFRPREGVWHRSMELVYQTIPNSNTLLLERMTFLVGGFIQHGHSPAVVYYARCPTTNGIYAENIEVYRAGQPLNPDGRPFRVFLDSDSRVREIQYDDRMMPNGSTYFRAFDPEGQCCLSRTKIDEDTDEYKGMSRWTGAAFSFKQSRKFDQT